MNKPCPLCDHTCTFEKTGPFNCYYFIENYKCPNCGRFSTLHKPSKDLIADEDFKSKAKYIAFERKLKGEQFMDYVLHDADDKTILSISPECKDLTFINGQEFIKDFPEPHEMLDRILLNLGRASKGYGSEIGISNNSKEPFSLNILFNDELYTIQQIVHELRVRGYISGQVSYTESKTNPDTREIKAHITVTSKGWQKINELKKISPESTQIFVAMSFAQEQNEIWEKGIKPGIEETGYKAMRIDEKPHNDKICDEIIAEIRKSRALVADFTGNRGGVYFEAGFAMGLGIPVIWIVDKKDIAGLHFDTRQYNHIVYENADELKAALSNRIKATGI